VESISPAHARCKKPEVLRFPVAAWRFINFVFLFFLLLFQNICPKSSDGGQASDSESPTKVAPAN